MLPGPIDAELSGHVEIFYEPGSDRLLLGGDFADVLRHPDGNLGFVLGDVCGHGPEAAALAIDLRASWAALELDRPDLERLAHRLNQVALRPRADHLLLFATMAIGRITADWHEARLLLAGYPPPIALEQPAAETQLPRGPLLGIHLDGQWTAGTTPISPAGILLYTDGLTEGRAYGPARSERYGLPRLLEAIQTHHCNPAVSISLSAYLLAQATAAHQGMATSSGRGRGRWVASTLR